MSILKLEADAVRSLISRIVAFALLSVVPSWAAQARATGRPGRSPAAVYANLPLAFERNDGQVAGDVRFLARAPGYTVWLKGSEAIFELAEAGTPRIVRLRFSGAAQSARAEGIDRLPGNANYLIGSDRTQWRTGVPTYRKVRYEAIYPGIDVVFRGSPRRMEFDLVVSPGADPQAIALTFAGAEGLRIEANGDLLIGGESAPLRLSRPVIYQELEGTRHPVDGGYVLAGDGTVRFRLGNYDPHSAVVIDPVVLYSTYLSGINNEAVQGIAVDGAGNAYVVGTTQSYSDSSFVPLPGSGGNHNVFVSRINPAGTALVYSVFFGGTFLDSGNAIAVDAQGHAYVTGHTQSADFPLVRPIQPSMGSPIQSSFIAKLNPSGTDFEFSTYFAGNGGSITFAIALDAAANAYIVGSGDPPTLNSISGSGNAFLSKLTSDGAVLLFSTKLGGTGFQRPLAVSVDPGRNVYVAGVTAAQDFPIRNAFQPALAGSTDAFVLKTTSTVVAAPLLEDTFDNENTGLTALDYTTFQKWRALSGTSDLIGADSPEFLPGSGAYVRLGGAGALPSQLESLAQFQLSPVASIHPAANPSFYRLSFNLGSAPAGSSGLGPAVSVRVGTAFAETFTLPDNAPRRAITREFAVLTQTDARVSFELVSGGAAALIDSIELSQLTEVPALGYATYLGGADDDSAASIVVDDLGSAYVTGSTSSSNFPLLGARQPQLSGPTDAFVTKIDSLGNLVYSSYFGGNDTDIANGIARDPEGNVYLAGSTRSSNLPTPNAVQAQPGGGEDAFVAKFDSTFALTYSTYLGGDSTDFANSIAVDGAGNAYVGGRSDSTDFPLANPLFAVQRGGSDGFVAKILDAPDVRLTALSPERGGNTGTVTVTIRGINLVVGPVSVTLSANGRADIVATSAIVTDSTRVSAVFDLQGRPPGTRDVVVAFSSGTPVALAGAFTVEDGGASALWVDVIGRTAVRGGVPSTYHVVFGNRGNIDSPDALLWIATPSGVSVIPDVAYLEEVDPPPNDQSVFVDGYAYTWFYASDLGAGKTRSLIARLTLAVPQAEVRAGIIPIDVVLPGLTPTAVASVRSASLRARAPISTTTTDCQPPGPCIGDLVYKLSNPDDPLQTGHVGIYVGPMTDSQGVPMACNPNCVIDMATTGLRVKSLEKWACSSPPCSPADGQETGEYLGAFRPKDATAAEADAAAEDAKARYLDTESRPLYGWPPIGPFEDCVSWVNDRYRAAGHDPQPSDLGPPAGLYEDSTNRVWPDSFYAGLRVGRLVVGFTAMATGSEAWPLFVANGFLQVHAVQAIDPNDKSGSQGVGQGRYVAGDVPLRYAISFENISTATASARDVTITDQLDPALVDLATVALGPMTFGSRQFLPPSWVSDFSTVVDLRPATNLRVQVTGSLNRQSGLLQWSFSSLDPATGLPPEDPTVGFLPPNVNAPEGDGSVFFTVMPKNTLPTGAIIRNQASILFDANAPIQTPEWSNALDRGKAASQVAPTPTAQCGTSIALAWSGTDAESGVLDYTIFASDNDAPYVPWLANTTQTGGVFTGAPGHSYAFYSVARDRVGNVEDAPAVADADISLEDAVPPILACPAALSVPATTPTGAAVIYATTATDNCGAPAVSCAPPSGSIFPIGTTSVACSAVDAASNTAGCTFAVTVRGAPEQLRDLRAYVLSLELAFGTETSLLSKLSDPPSCGKLAAFINEVNAQTGKKIAAEPAANLVREASRIRAVLGCL